MLQENATWGKESSQKTALHLAAANGHYEVVEALVSAGAPITSKDDRKRATLHYAALGNHEKVPSTQVDVSDWLVALLP